MTDQLPTAAIQRQLMEAQARLTEHDRQAILLGEAIAFADSAYKKIFSTPRFAALSAAAGAQLMLLEAERTRMLEDRDDLVTALSDWATWQARH